MIRTFAIALCIVAAAAAAWMAIARYAVPISGDTAWVRGLYERKEAAARRIAEPKIVLIGGSGTHYSFSAEYLAKRTGIPAVNLGTHAGLGLEYLLYRARRSLRPGDVAVLAIEPPLYHRNTVSAVLANQVVKDDFAFILHAPSYDGVRIFFGLNVRELLRDQARSLLGAVPHPTRRPESVSPWGDESLDVSKYVVPGVLALPDDPPAMKLDLPKPDSPPRTLTRFFAWAASNGVTVAQAWTPTLALPANQREDYRAYFRRVSEWYRQAEAIRLGEIEQYVLGREDMFETIFHANERGRIKATEVLAREFCKARKCPAAPAATDR